MITYLVKCFKAVRFDNNYKMCENNENLGENLHGIKLYELYQFHQRINKNNLYKKLNDKEKSKMKRLIEAYMTNEIECGDYVDILRCYNLENNVEYKCKNKNTFIYNFCIMNKCPSTDNDMIMIRRMAFIDLQISKLNYMIKNDKLGYIIKQVLNEVGYVYKKNINRYV